MTKDEFSAILQAKRRLSNRVGTVFLISFFGMCAVSLILLDFMNSRHIQNWLILLPYALIIFYFVFMLAYLYFVFRKSGDFPTCPSCGKALFGRPSEIAIATGKCGHCGQKIFDT
jgi:hypothetical protein